MRYSQALRYSQPVALGYSQIEALRYSHAEALLRRGGSRFRLLFDGPRSGFDLCSSSPRIQAYQRRPIYSLFRVQPCAHLTVEADHRRLLAAEAPDSAIHSVMSAR